MIILTGYESAKIFAYENDIFSPLLSLQARAYKMVCERWVVTKSSLYESQTSKNDKWEVHGINWTDSFFWMPTSFRKSQFIYFISNSSNTLWRINTQLKTLNEIAYNKEINRRDY